MHKAKQANTALTSSEELVIEVFLVIKINPQKQYSGELIYPKYDEFFVFCSLELNF